ncbi:MAG: hypothetical protein Q7R30_20465 [Acidobacteriota bacterium]|nr:hypothetical protein [Acidobacteriota bacterium]
MRAVDSPLRAVGNALIARTLVRAGWRVSPETVRRIRRERPIAPPAAPRGSGVIASRPNQVWLIDLTSIPGLFRATTFHVGVIFDAFARLPLGWRVFVRRRRRAKSHASFSRQSIAAAAPVISSAIAACNLRRRRFDDGFAGTTSDIVSGRLGASAPSR